MAKHAKAPRLQIAKPNILSQRLNVNQLLSSAGAGGGGSEFDTGRRTYPLFPKGLKDWIFERNGDDAVVTGASVRRDHPKEFICDRNDSAAMGTDEATEDVPKLWGEFPKRWMQETLSTSGAPYGWGVVK